MENIFDDYTAGELFQWLSEITIDEYIDAIIEEIDFSGNNEMLYTDENMEKIRNTEAYQEFMSYREYLGDDEFMSVLKEMHESKTGTANEINIEYLLLEDMK